MEHGLRCTRLTFIPAWVDTLVEAPMLTAAGHLDNVELTHARLTLKVKRSQNKQSLSTDRWFNLTAKAKNYIQ